MSEAAAAAAPGRGKKGTRAEDESGDERDGSPAKRRNGKEGKESKDKEKDSKAKDKDSKRGEKGGGKGKKSHKATRKSLEVAAPLLIKATCFTLQQAREQESIAIDTFLVDSDTALPQAMKTKTK